jgi:periplasmic divalent cation tolerance protein
MRGEVKRGRQEYAKGTIVMSTFPSKKVATKVATKLIERKLCACANFMVVNSVYTWRGKIHNECEYLCLFKTTTPNLCDLKREIISLHPYEVPEVVELKMQSVSSDYLDWMTSVTLPFH